MDDLTYYQPAIDAAGELINNCYVLHDPDKILNAVDHNHISWIGLSQNAMSYGYEKMAGWFTTALPLMPEYEVLELDNRIVCADGDLCTTLSTFYIRLLQEDRSSEKFFQRMTLVHRRTGGEWKIIHIHISVPAEYSQCNNFPLIEQFKKHYSALNAEYQKQLDAYKLEHIRSQVVMELIQDWILEYDVKTDTLDLYERNPLTGQREQKTFRYFKKHHNFFANSRITKEDSESLEHYILEEDLDGRKSLEFRSYDALGKTVWYRILARKIVDESGDQVKVIGCISDISREKVLLTESQTDALTGAYNRRYLMEQINAYLKNPGRETKGVLLMVDVDNFKMLNDTYSHVCGDTVLTTLVSLFRSNFRRSDCISRIGGDEFMIFMPDVYEENFVIEKAERLLAQYRDFIKDYPTTQQNGLSIGIVIVNPDCPYSSEEYYFFADKALYEAKKKGKNAYQIYQI